MAHTFKSQLDNAYTIPDIIYHPIILMIRAAAVFGFIHWITHHTTPV